MGGNAIKLAKADSPSKAYTLKPITPAMRFHARYANADCPPTLYSVANAAVNSGLPTTPFNADAIAATSNPIATRGETLSLPRNQMAICWTRIVIGPSGPTLAPDRSEQNDDRSV